MLCLGKYRLTADAVLLHISPSALSQTANYAHYHKRCQIIENRNGFPCRAPSEIPLDKSPSSRYSLCKTGRRTTPRTATPCPQIKAVRRKIKNRKPYTARTDSFGLCMAFSFAGQKGCHSYDTGGSSIPAPQGLIPGKAELSGLRQE